MSAHCTAILYVCMVSKWVMCTCWPEALLDMKATMSDAEHRGQCRILCRCVNDLDSHCSFTGNLIVYKVINCFSKLSSSIYLSIFVCSMTYIFCLLCAYSRLTITAADGLKLKNRAARFANTLGDSEAPKVRTEPLILTRSSVSLIILSSFFDMMLFSVQCLFRLH